MDDFLKKFFYHIYLKKQHAVEDNYCRYNDQKLQLFTSSLHVAALFACLAASKVCSMFGRKITIQIASLFFLIGVIVNTSAENLATLIAGRVILGFGIGFANQSVPLFLSEIAPSRIRGGLNIVFQLMITIGIFISNIVNYLTSFIHPWGWRVSLGLAGVPALVLLVGSLKIVETPTSLVEREKNEEALASLKKIRGTETVDVEFDEIVHACEMARQVKAPYRNLMKRHSRPQLVIAVAMQVFQQLTGINAIMFYAPVLFQTVGFKHDASLLSSVITGLVNVLSTLVAVFVVDRAGRKILLLEACVQMFIAHVNLTHSYVRSGS